MKMNILVKIIPIAFVINFFLNYVFQVILLGSWNATHLDGIRRPESDLNPGILAIDFFLLTAVLTFLVTSLNTSGNMKKSAVIGFIFGAMLTIHYGLLNMFILPTGYPVAMIFSDIFAIGIVFSITSCVVTALDKKLKSE